MLNNLKFELIEKTLYNFNLISITSSELMEFYFEGDSSYKITPTTIPEINHFNTYIVSQNRENQKIHFIQFDKFDSILNNYDYLCEWNEKYYFTLIYQFYKNIFRKNDDRRILFDDIEKELITFFQNLEDIEGRTYSHITDELCKSKVNDIKLIKNENKYISVELKNEYLDKRLINIVFSNDDVLNQMKEIINKVYRNDYDVKVSYYE